MTVSYQEQKAWKEIQMFLPQEMHFNEKYSPKEETWDWKGHTVHLDRFEQSKSKYKVILLHGVGTNGRQMSTILGGPLSKRGFETVAIDLPNYGVTAVKKGTLVSYDDWVELVNDFINAELERDGKPVVLYGLSAGGMLSYHAAAVNKKVSGIIGMTFLNQQEQSVRDETSYNLFMSRSAPFVSFMSATPFAGMKIPMRVVSKMYALVNNKEALKTFYTDKTSAGNWASMRFLHTYMNFQPAIEPEDFDVCPILLTQPDKDTWTPLHVSEIFLDRIKKVKKEIVKLENAGHYPLEQPGLKQMEDSIVSFINNLSG